MAILDQMIVPSRHPKDSARLLDERWEPESMGTFSAEHVNDSLTIDFGEAMGFDVHHYCFMVTGPEFDAIHARLVEKKIPYRSSPHGPVDMRINTASGGKNLYWFDDDNHNWEILTVSYAR